MTFGFVRSLPAVGAILTQASLFLALSALGAGLGRAALGAVFNVWFRRFMAVCFIIYGVLLGATPGRSI